MTVRFGVEYATLEWADCFNIRCWLEPIGDVPPSRVRTGMLCAAGKWGQSGLAQANESPDLPGQFTAAKGLGIVSLPAYTCRDELKDGSLVRVLPEWIAGNAQLSLLMPSRRGQSPCVRVLAEYLLNNLNDRIGDRPG